MTDNKNNTEVLREIKIGNKTLKFILRDHYLIIKTEFPNSSIEGNSQILGYLSDIETLSCLSNFMIHKLESKLRITWVISIKPSLFTKQSKMFTATTPLNNEDYDNFIPWDIEKIS